MIKSLDELHGLLADGTGPARVAVVKAADAHVLDAVVPAALEGLVLPVLIDDAQRTRELLAGRLAEGQYELVDLADDVAAATEGVRLVREGRAQVLMKGLVSSGTFLKPVVNRETGIRTSPLLSHVAVVDNPAIGRLVTVTDGGMVAQPGPDDYPALVVHAARVARLLGSEQPKVALLSAAETPVPRLESAQVQLQLTQEQPVPGVVVEGPLSLDLAVSPASVAEKGYRGQVQGDADVLVAPDIVVANAMVKALTMFGNGRMAGVVLGAAAPVVLVSRSATADEKYCSLLLAAIVGAEHENGAH